MAEAIFNASSKKDIAISAGISSKANGYDGRTLREAGPIVTAVMKDNGYDVSRKVSKQLEPGMLEAADLVVYMAGGSMPAMVMRHKNVVVWNDIPDPRLLGRKADIQVFLLIREHVSRLLSELEE